MDETESIEDVNSGPSGPLTIALLRKRGICLVWVPVTAKESRALKIKVSLSIVALLLFLGLGAGADYYLLENTRDYERYLYVGIALIILVGGSWQTWQASQQSTSCLFKGVVTKREAIVYGEKSIKFYHYYFEIGDRQRILLTSDDYNLFKQGDILEISCLNFDELGLPRHQETRNYFNLKQTLTQ